MAIRSCWLLPAALDHKLEEGLTGEEPMLGVVTLRGVGEGVVMVVRFQLISAALSILSQIPAAKVGPLAL